jgi:hypothetical protein
VEDRRSQRICETIWQCVEHKRSQKMYVNQRKKMQSKRKENLESCYECGRNKCNKP